MYDAGVAELKQYLVNSRSPLIGLVMALPLLVFYNVGLLATDWRALNGADFITWALVETLDRTGYLITQGVLIAAFLVAIGVLQRKRQFHPSYFVPLLAESLVYALGMGSLILMLMREAHLLGPTGSGGLLTVLTISAGAGVHEELVFRLLLIPLLAALATRALGMKPGLAMVVAVVASSVLFSLAHYLGPESFQAFTFAYRSLAGLVFATLFLARGFAVAVYTHALYDVYVLAFR